MNKLLPILLVVVLSGCAMKMADYDNLMDSWIGANQDDLISAWGIPTKTLELRDSIIHEWIYESSYTTNDTRQITTDIFGNTKTIGQGPSTVSIYCKLTVMVNKQNYLVRSLKYKGRDCRKKIGLKLFPPNK